MNSLTMKSYKAHRKRPQAFFLIFSGDDVTIQTRRTEINVNNCINFGFNRRKLKHLSTENNNGFFSSSAPSNTSTDTNPNRNSAPITITTSPAINSTTNASKNLRGLNKPKCIKCGNVARSRCPYQSCKSCCAKAQNPCHIHVLKGNSTFLDKAPASGSPLSEQQPNDVYPSG